MLLGSFSLVVNEDIQPFLIALAAVPIKMKIKAVEYIFQNSSPMEVSILYTLKKATDVSFVRMEKWN